MTRRFSCCWVRTRQPKRPEEVPTAAHFVAVFYGRAARTRRAVGRLALELADAPAPGALRDVLARSVGDDLLEVAYWLDGPRLFVDADGHAVDPLPDRHHIATTIIRAGRKVAVVVHDRTLLEARDLRQEIGAAARLAVDNERPPRRRSIASADRLRRAAACPGGRPITGQGREVVDPCVGG